MQQLLRMLKQLIRENAWFFGAFALFLLTGAVALAFLQPGDAVFFFSERRTPWSDWFFRNATRLGEEPPFYAAVLGLLFLRYRYALAVPVLALSVTLTSFGAKSLFQQPRPYSYIETLGKLEQLCVVPGVDVHTGNNSFPSGHTMAAFALFAFLTFVLPRGRRYGLGLLFFLLALLVGLSRIYLVQHFLKDVYLGAILGVALAVFFYFLQKRYPAPPHPYLDRSLLTKGSTGNGETG